MNSIDKILRLDKRIALVTGAAGNLGRMIATTLAEQGAELILVDLPSADFSSLENDLSRINNIQHEILPCDLSSDVSRKKLKERVLEKGSLSVLVNNAAYVGSSNLEGYNVPFHSQTTKAMREAFEVNLIAVFELCRDLTPVLDQSINPSIINIGSIHADNSPNWSLYKDTGIFNPIAYSISKAGVVQLTRWLATTISPQIRVNVISPGGIERNQSDEFIEKYSDMTPLKRMAKEEDIKGAIVFLSSDLSLYVTGQNIKVDGGYGL